jgi:hypothetical protein
MVGCTVGHGGYKTQEKQNILNIYVRTMDLQKLALLILVVSGLNIGACAVFDKDPLRALLGKSFTQIFAVALNTQPLRIL